MPSSRRSSAANLRAGEGRLEGAGGLRRQGTRRHHRYLGRHHPSAAGSTRRRSIRSSSTFTPARKARSCRSRFGLQPDAVAGRARVHRGADRRHGHVEPIEGVPRCCVEEPRRRRLPRSHLVAQGRWRRSTRSTTSTRVGIYGGSAGGQNALGGLLFHPEFYKAGVAYCGCHDNRMDKIWWNEQWMGWPIGPQYCGVVECRQRVSPAGQPAADGRRAGPQCRPLVDDAGGESADQARQGFRPAGRARRQSPRRPRQR